MRSVGRCGASQDILLAFFLSGNSALEDVADGDEGREKPATLPLQLLAVAAVAAAEAERLNELELPPVPLLLLPPWWLLLDRLPR